LKLFQKLLITPAVLGLLTPLAGSANELNLTEVSSYSSSAEVLSINEFNAKELAVTNSHVDGLEAELNNFEAGSFSETTTMSGSASFQVGAVDEGNLSEALTSTYSYKLDLNSSFTGDDNLYVGIETGNSGSVNFATDDSVAGSDTLSVASMYYQFPIGNFDIAVGPKLDNDDLMPTTISTYSDKFFMAGYSLLKSNAYLYDYTGAGIAVSRNFDNGFNASGSIIGTSASTTSGLLTDEGIDIITLSAGYDGDNYGGGIVYVDGDDYCGIVNSYISNGCTTLGVSTLQVDVVGIGAYWTPNEGKTTISATTNLVTPTVTGMDIDNISDLQIGLEHQMFDGVLSASWKTIPLYNVVSSTDLNQDTLGSYFEVYYTQPVNDSFDLTYGVAMASPDTTSGDSFELLDYTAIGAQATFKF
jgi:hypothetical protein